MNDQKLLDELVRAKFLEGEVLDRVKKIIEVSSRNLEDVLYEEKLVSDESVARLKSELLSVPYKDIDPDAIHSDLLELIPYDTSKTYKVIPIERDDNMLVVGMINPEDENAKNALRFIAKQEHLNLGVYIIKMSDLRAVWRRYMPFKTEIQSAVEEIGKINPQEDIVGLDQAMSNDEDAPIIKIVASTLRQAVDIMASDVHIEPQRSRLRIRFRVNGDLQEVSSLPIGLSQPVVSRIKVLSNLKLDETRMPQDGRFRTIIFGRDIDFRVSTFPTPSGEKVAIRVLDPTLGMKRIEDLGLEEYNMDSLKKGLESPYGMILITGPTGSGKTTTLYSMMNKLNSDDVNIVSLEDPVEYFMSGINQSQVLPEIGYTFASGLRQILRQDPDIIMVGEIRDSETAGLAVNAALTGHLMLSTMHTNNSISVIPRLIDLQVPSFLLPSTLNIMIAQRLLSRLCSNCKKEKEASPEATKVIEEQIEKLPEKVKNKIKTKYPAPYKIFEPEPKEDCEICGGKGNSGRIAIFEIFRMTKNLAEIISSGFSKNKLFEEAERQGMISLRQDGIIKALKGEVLIGEVLRETEE
ncbi:MAG: GspE/PulE family protein [Candidatus Paceibacterota bacterium]